MPQNRDCPSGAKSKTSSADAPREDRLHQVRAILFGDKADEIDSRLEEIERSVAAKNEALQAACTERLRELEVHFTAELNRVVGLVEQESQERLNDVAQTSREVLASAKAMEKRLDKLDGHRESGERELRQQLSDQSKSLAGEIQDSSRRLTRLIEGHVATFTEAKLDRDAFSKILVEAAERVSHREGEVQTA